MMGNIGKMGMEQCLQVVGGGQLLACEIGESSKRRKLQIMGRHGRWCLDCNK